MSDDPRRNPPPCPRPTCTAGQGDPNCYTATGFPRGMHAVRLRLIAGTPPPGPADAGSLTRRRPTDLQNRILCRAIHDGGQWELSGYRFHGDAQRRAAMHAMAAPGRGWFTKVRETPHGTLYEITDAGRVAAERYEAWMCGDPTTS